MKSTYIIYKPYGMLSQFSRELPQHITLADLDYSFEKDVYPIGRLDADSEGLLLLSNDKSLTDRLLNPKKKQPKTYWVQVEGVPTHSDLSSLTKGVSIRVKKKEYKTLPAEYKIMIEPELPPRIPPIRERKSIPTSWVSITLIEGKNRQVRKMLAATGYPVLRLVRAAIGQYRLDDSRFSAMLPGDVIKI